MHKWILALLIVFSLTTSANAASKKTELSRVVNQIQELQNNINLDKQQQQTLEKKLQTTEVAIGELSQQINKINIFINQEQMQLSQLDISHQQMLTKLSQENRALAQRLRAAYQLQQLQSFKIILNQDDPNILQRHLNYYHYLTQTRIQLINSIKQTLSKLNANMDSISQHQRILKKLLVQKQLQQVQLQRAQAQRPALIAQLKQGLQSKQLRLSTLLANQKGLQDIISHLKQESEQDIANLPFKNLHGKLNWPVNGKIVANFGSILDVGNQHFSGVLITAAQGTPVRAIYSGRVIFADWLRGFGLLIIINHSNNYMSLYGHNHALYAKVGDQVNTGDVIATIGNSGGFDKSSLYFEIRQNGIAVDPNTWCR